MGFLDNSTVTVDAILTKRGREILSQGGNFNITKFALSDEEVDYTLYDVTHPSGTDSYGNHAGFSADYLLRPNVSFDCRYWFCFHFGSGVSIRRSEKVIEHFEEGFHADPEKVRRVAHLDAANVDPRPTRGCIGIGRCCPYSR